MPVILIQNQCRGHNAHLFRQFSCGKALECPVILQILARCGAFFIGFIVKGQMNHDFAFGIEVNPCVIEITIGNTLAHLQNAQEIFRFFQQVYQHLHPTGILILQTVNFDQINKLKTFEFPVIRKENCIFMRKYEQNGTYIRFVITLKTQNEIRSNTTILFPASSQTILQLLQEAGFSHLQTYGNFKKEAFEKTSSAFIVIGQKV